MYNTLQSQALRLVFRLDELLEPLEDCEHVSNPERARKLRRALKHASIRYYRRRAISKPSPYSIIESILKKAEEPEPPKEIVSELTYQVVDELPSYYDHFSFPGMGDIQVDWDSVRYWNKKRRKPRMR